MKEKRITLKKLASLQVGVAISPKLWFKPMVMAIALPAHAQTSDNQSPTFTQSVFDTGLTLNCDGAFQGNVVPDQLILDLSTVSSDADGDQLTYSVQKIIAPNDGGSFSDPLVLTFETAIIIKDALLVLRDFGIEGIPGSGPVTVTVRVSDGERFSEADVVFQFQATCEGR